MPYGTPYSYDITLISICQVLSKSFIIFQNGTIQAKRNILSKLGSNLVWNDKELNIYNSNAVNKLVEGIKLAKSLSPKFEPKNFVVYKGSNEKTDAFSPVFSTMLHSLDAFRTLNWVAIKKEIELSGILGMFYFQTTSELA